MAEGFCLEQLPGVGWSERLVLLRTVEAGSHRDSGLRTSGLKNILDWHIISVHVYELQCDVLIHIYITSLNSET